MMPLLWKEELVQFEINTGDAPPNKQPARCVPFAVRQEVARQLREMQESGVNQPSSSLSSSAIVLVRKKDGSLRLYVDYRELNLVTKADNSLYHGVMISSTSLGSPSTSLR